MAQDETIEDYLRAVENPQLQAARGLFVQTPGWAVRIRLWIQDWLNRLRAGDLLVWIITVLLISLLTRWL